MRKVDIFQFEYDSHWFGSKISSEIRLIEQIF